MLTSEFVCDIISKLSERTALKMQKIKKVLKIFKKDIDKQFGFCYNNLPPQKSVGTDLEN